MKNNHEVCGLTKKAFLNKMSLNLSLIMLLSSVSSTVLAVPSKNKDIAKNNMTLKKHQKDQSVGAPTGKVQTAKELQSFKNVKNKNEVKSITPSMPMPSLSNKVQKGQKANEGEQEVQTYTMASLKSYSNNQLVEILAKIQPDQITDLFQYNNDAYAFYSDKYRVQALIDGIYNMSQQFTENDTKGIPTIVEVIRAGYYLGFYHKELSYLTEREQKEKCLSAISVVQRNPNFKLGSDEQNKVVESMALLVGNTACNGTILNNFTSILRQFNGNPDEYINIESARNAMFRILQGTEYSIRYYDRKLTPEQTPFYRATDSFVNEAGKIALLNKDFGDQNWIITNALFNVGTLGKYASDDRAGLKICTEAMKLYPYLSEEYIQAADIVMRDYGAKDYDGKSIDSNKIKDDAKQKLLPMKYVFDNGKVVIKAGKDVTQEKIKRLYWASKEVSSQFFRFFGSDKPLEQGHTDEVLTIVIYNNPTDYKMNNLLYGLDTNNGGMYIEQSGTFFTYERTPQDSIYTLEELFRHEFTHYLQGRYLAPGMWGSSDIYQDERITWFEEGGAELFAGSTRTNNIQPRSAIVGNLVRSTSKYALNDTLHSKYSSGFEFYNFACAFNEYMYEKNPTLFAQITEAIKKNDIKAYDDLIRKLSSDSNLDREYQEFMQKLKNDYPNISTPLVADDYLYNHEYKPSNEIYNDITSVASLKNVKTEEEKSEFFNTFVLRGSYTGENSKGKVEDLKKMNEVSNKFLETLNTYSWSGYKTVTCYFTNYRVNTSNKVEFDVVFRGVLPQDGGVGSNLAPIAKINGSSEGIKGKELKFTSEGSSDADGVIVGYVWDFGDGTTSKDVNASHTYNKPGKYTVTLKATDDRGAVGTATTEVNVKDTASTEQLKINVPNTAVKAKAIRFTSIANAGEIKSYAWDFGDGATSVEANPCYTYNAQGKYTVKLTVVNADGQSYSASKEITVVEPLVEGISRETEENDAIDKASGPIVAGRTVSASIDSQDNTDFFYFDVKEKGEVKIDLIKSPAGMMTWVVYAEANPGVPVAYVTNEAGNQLSGSFTATPGKYYVHVYCYGQGSGYGLNVNGPLVGGIGDGSGSTQPGSTETESNNSFNEANKLSNDSTLSATLDDSDAQDYYYFDVASQGNVSIKANNKDNIGMVWTLYSENDLTKPIAYPKKPGKDLSGSINLKPGKYYIYVYKYEGTEGSYTINVKGNLK